MSITDQGEVIAPKTLHFSSGKVGVDQIPAFILMEWGAVYSYGAKKYARDNWKSGTNWYEFYGSAMRHILKFQMGKDYDDCDIAEEGCANIDRRLWSDEQRVMWTTTEYCPKHSGLHHLSHALWNIGTLRYYQAWDIGHDTREVFND